MNFDTKAKDWDSNPLNIERTKAIAAAIRLAVPLATVNTAFEYGCGTGLLSFHLMEELKDITLADTSDGMLKILKEKISKAKACHMKPLKLDLLTDPLPKARFDLVYIAMTLHHVEDTEKILGLFNKLLNPSGFLCIADLDKEDGSFHEDEFHGHHGFSRKELKVKLQSQGFGNMQFETVFNITKDINGKKKKFPVFLVVAQKL